MNQTLLEVSDLSMRHLAGLLVMTLAQQVELQK